MSRPQCGGGKTGTCANPGTHMVKHKDMPDVPRSWSHACGQHLAFACDEITGGENTVDLDYRRALCDER